MNFAKQILIVMFFAWAPCFGAFWNHNTTHVMDAGVPTVPIAVVPHDPNSMNQNLTFNLNYSPTQIKGTVNFSDKLFSNLPIKEWQSKVSGFLYERRYVIGTSIILGGYGLACAYFVQGNKYLERTDTWTSWHNDTSLELLISIPQAEFAKELILEIQRRYSNAQNPTDFITPLISFMQIINTEILTIKRYMTAYRWLKQLHLQNMFFINQKQFNLLDEKYKKLLYFKNIFLSWAAEYKVNHNKNRHPMPAYK